MLLGEGRGGGRRGHSPPQAGAAPRLPASAAAARTHPAAPGRSLLLVTTHQQPFKWPRHGRRRTFTDESHARRGRAVSRASTGHFSCPAAPLADDLSHPSRTFVPLQAVRQRAPPYAQTPTATPPAGNTALVNYSLGPGVGSTAPQRGHPTRPGPVWPSDTAGER